MPYLLLTLNDLEVRYEGFIFEDGSTPKDFIADLAGTITHSVDGDPTVSGSATAPKQIWTFSIASQCDEVLADKTRELWSEYDYLRRTTNTIPPLVLEDGREYYFERSPRTRALATGANEIITSPGRIKYYAKYYVGFERPPEFQQGEGFTVQLVEGATFAA